MLIAAFGVALTGPASAAILVEYDASLGSPAGAGDIVDPNHWAGNGAAWSMFHTPLGGTDSQTGVISDGLAAWQNLDGTNNNNPGFTNRITETQFELMYDYGWKMTTVVKLVQGGAFQSIGFGGSTIYTDNGVNANERAGYSLGASGADVNITPVGGTVISATGALGTTGAGNEDDGDFVRIVMEGAAQSTDYSFKVFDMSDTQIGSTQTIGINAGNANANTNSAISWQSGSSQTDNRETFTHLTRLEVTDPSVRRVAVPWLTTQEIVESGAGAGEVNEGNPDTTDGNGYLHLSPSWVGTNQPEPGGGTVDQDWVSVINDDTSDDDGADLFAHVDGVLRHTTSETLAAEHTYIFAVDLISGTSSSTNNDYDIFLEADGVRLVSLSDDPTADGDLAGAAFDKADPAGNATESTAKTISFTTGGTAPSGTSFGDSIVLGFHSGGVDGRENVFIYAVEGSFDFVVVPEPGTMALLALGGLGVLRRRRR